MIKTPTSKFSVLTNFLFGCSIELLAFKDLLALASLFNALFALIDEPFNVVNFGLLPAVTKNSTHHNGNNSIEIEEILNVIVLL